MWSQWPWPIRIWSALLTCWSMSVVSVGRAASIFSLFWRKPDSKRLNQGSMRMVLLPKVISQPLVPNHVKLTPAVPGPPPRGDVSAPSAAPGVSSDRPRFAAAATPAATPPARKPRRDHSTSTKHISLSSRVTRVSCAGDSSPACVRRVEESRRLDYSRVVAYVSEPSDGDTGSRHRGGQRTEQQSDPEPEGRRSVSRRRGVSQRSLRPEEVRG